MKDNKIDWFLIFLGITISVSGVIVLYGGGGETQAIKKAIWLFLGIALMILFRYINYQLLGAYSYVIYGVSIFILMLTLVPFIGTQVKGARSWIRFWGVGFQPTELAKYALVITLSKYLNLREAEIDQFKELVIPFIITSIPILLIGLQPDLGYAIMFLPLLLFMLFIGGANIRILLSLFLIGFFILFIPMYLEYHQLIIIEDIKDVLQESHVKLADAVHILSFDLWKYLDQPAISKMLTSKGDLHGWATNIIRLEENQNLIKKITSQLFHENPIFLRDFLRNKFNIIITILISLFIYGTLTLITFFTKINSMKQIRNVLLLIAIPLSTYLASTYFVHFKTHQIVRIVSFANPEKFQKGAGYQLRHALITLGSGKIMGKGVVGGDMTKGDIPFLPEWYNDFIFSVVGEQFGFLGSLMILMLLFLIIIRGFIIALHSKDEFGSLLASGITIIFFLHISINLGITMGILPVTGIPLIFLSSGGSNMVTSFIALGILLNINARRFIN